MNGIEFTQYLLPDGRKRTVYFEATEDIQKKADVLIAQGCHFDAEILRNGVVSLTCEKRDEILSIELSENGPPIVEAVKSLIENAYSKEIK